MFKKKKKQVLFTEGEAIVVGLNKAGFSSLDRESPAMRPSGYLHTNIRVYEFPKKHKTHSFQKVDVYMPGSHTHYKRTIRRVINMVACLDRREATIKYYNDDWALSTIMLTDFETLDAVEYTEAEEDENPRYEEELAKAVEMYESFQRGITKTYTPDTQRVVEKEAITDLYFKARNNM